MNNSIVRSVKQRGTAIVEYVVILSFVCVVGWGFVGSDNGMTGSIGSIINSVERLLGMTGVIYVDKENQVHFNGKGTGSVKLGNTTFGPNDEWTWWNIWTDDVGDRYAGSAFLNSSNSLSNDASNAAKQLVDEMFEKGSFGGVDPMSWAFTEGCGGSYEQSLNLYWSNSDWYSIPNGQQVPIIQMNKEKNGDLKYYVAMANVSDGKLELWNQAAALKGQVTYYGPNGKSETLTSSTSGSAPGNYNGVDTASRNLSDKNLSFDNYNDAQKVYYDVVAQNGIKVNNSYNK